MNRIITATLLMGYINVVLAQDPGGATPTPVMTPASPEVAAMNKYGEIPISHFSGVPNISIPIYTVEQGDLKIPIGLSYHAGGFKVDEMASEVGLGWSLSVGGMISRSKNGKADEGGAGGYFAVANNIDLFHINSNNPAHTLKKYDDYEQMDKISQGIWDLQPDVFSFNILGKYSGQFIINYDGGIFTMPSSRVKIIAPITFLGPQSETLRYGAAEDEWAVITTDGFKFFFGGGLEFKEQTYQTSSEVSSEEDFDSSWFLKKIVSPGGQLARFYYDSETIEYDVVNSHTIYTPVIKPGSCTRPPSLNFSQISVYTQKISRIETNNYRVDFERGNREDLNGASRLDELYISKRDQAEFYVIKYAKLFNDKYFGSQGNNKRLKLEKLRLAPNVYQAGQDEFLDYSFEYDESVELPEPTSYSKDHWGYYNGANNFGLVPEMEYQNQVLQGADRAVNDTYSLAYLLKRITYPTKGFSEFEYETNQYYVEEPFYEDKTEVISQSGIPGGSVSPVESSYFSISHDQNVTIDALIDYDSSVPLGDGSGGYVKIEDTSGNVIFSVGGEEEVDEVFNAQLPEGGYYLRIYNEDINGTHIQARVSYQRDKGLHPKQYKVGGARVKKITSNPLNGLSTVKSYHYDPYDIVLFNDPDPYSYTYELCEPLREQPENCDCNFLVRTSSSRFFGGSQAVGYKKVHEVLGDLEKSQCYGEGPLAIPLAYDVCDDVNGSIGKTTYRFFSGFDSGNGGWPFTPRKQQTWKRGLMTEKDIYDANGANLEHVEKDYICPKVDTLAGLVIGKVKAPNLGQFDNLQVTTAFTQIYYDYKSEPAYLNSSTTIKDGVKTEEYHQYNDDFLTSRHTLVTHSNDTIVSEYKYPNDFSGQGVHQKLTDKNFYLCLLR